MRTSLLFAALLPVVAAIAGCNVDNGNKTGCRTVCDNVVHELGKPACQVVCYGTGNGGAGGDTTTTTNTCPDGQSACGATCVTLESDPANCGACGMHCVSQLVCGNAQCQAACPVNTTHCADGACADLTNDEANCGACGTKCAINETCKAGECLGTGGSGGTGGAGGDTNTGGAGGTTSTTSSTTTTTTSNSATTCSPACESGKDCCGTACVDFTADKQNCGACGATCNAGYICIKPGDLEPICCPDGVSGACVAPQ